MEQNETAATAEATETTQPAVETATETTNETAAAPAEATETPAEENEAPAEENEEISYHAVEKDGSITAIWEMQGRKHLRTIDPRSIEGRHIMSHFTSDESAA